MWISKQCLTNGVAKLWCAVKPGILEALGYKITLEFVLAPC